jgi:hypothetical protein
MRCIRDQICTAAKSTSRSAKQKLKRRLSTLDVPRHTANCLSLRAAADEPTMRLRAQTARPTAPDHVARVQQNAQLSMTRVELSAPPASGTALSSRERQELRAACERFIAQQPGKLIDLRTAQ